MLFIHVTFLYDIVFQALCCLESVASWREMMLLKVIKQLRKCIFKAKGEKKQLVASVSLRRYVHNPDPPWITGRNLKPFFAQRLCNIVTTPNHSLQRLCLFTWNNARLS